MAVLAAVSSMSACIIPVAPDFRDPPNPPASVPLLQPISPTPLFGAIYALQKDMTFQVSVSDPDPGAVLEYQWVFDYPPNTFGPPQQAKSGTVTPPTTSLDLNCQSIDTSLSTTHQLELYVTNGSFDTSNHSIFGKAQDPGSVVVSDGWTIQFQITCGP